MTSYGVEALRVGRNNEILRGYRVKVTKVTYSKVFATKEEAQKEMMRLYEGDAA